MTMYEIIHCLQGLLLIHVYTLSCTFHIYKDGSFADQTKSTVS